MKRINLHSLVLLIFFAAAFSAPLVASYGQNKGEPKRYKLGEIRVGDLVEVDPIGEIGSGQWYKCKVTRVDDGIFPGEAGSYVVMCYAPESQYGATYHPRADATHVRPMNGTHPAEDINRQPGDRADGSKGNLRQGNAEGEKQTNAQTPEGCSCKVETDPKKSGPPSAELFKALIKAQFDKEAKPGQDGAVCLTFTKFQMGAAQQWRPEADPRRVGTERLGTKPKAIYPVKANYIVCTIYNSAWQTTEWADTVYTCFKDEAFGEWKCRGEQGFDWKYKSKYIEKH